MCSCGGNHDLAAVHKLCVMLSSSLSNSFDSPLWDSFCSCRSDGTIPLIILISLAEGGSMHRAGKVTTTLVLHGHGHMLSFFRMACLVL